jgi:hypothetical protein
MLMREYVCVACPTWAQQHKVKTVRKETKMKEQHNMNRDQLQYIRVGADRSFEKSQRRLAGRRALRRQRHSSPLHLGLTTSSGQRRCMLVFSRVVVQRVAVSTRSIIVKHDSVVACSVAVQRGAATAPCCQRHHLLVHWRRRGTVGGSDPQLFVRGVLVSVSC